MRPWSCDSETYLIRKGKMAPELVVITFADGASRGMLLREDCKPLLTEKLKDKNTCIVLQNAAFDMAVFAAAFPDLLPLIFEAYKDGRIADTMIRQWLLDIAAGCYRGYMDEDQVWHKLNYSLDALAMRHLGKYLKKDGWRLRFREFDGLPLDQWEAHASVLQTQAQVLLDREASKPVAERYYDGYEEKDLVAILQDPPGQVLVYPLDDASTTLDVYLAQEAAPPEALRPQYFEAYAAFCLHLSSVWGLRTNHEGVDALEKDTLAAIEDVKDALIAEGLVRADGSRDTKKAAAHMVMVCDRDNITLRKTKGGGVCLDDDACKASEDPLLLKYSEYTSLGKTLNADVPMLRKGTENPVHCKYGMAETSRTTCSGPNLQNMRKLPGIRESFQPRPGMVFVQDDFPQLELFTLAQVCYTWLGHSKLGDMLKAGIDPHTAFAATLMGCTYEEGMKLRKSKDAQFDKMRQVAKAFNFGKPGGLGSKRLVELAASNAYRVTITEYEAAKYGKTWLQTFPEMPEYFAHIKNLLGYDGLATIEIPGTGFIRGGAKYCAACNCVDDETEALTRRGWIKGFDLKSDDILLTKNPATGNLEWQGMTDIKIYPDYEGPVVEIKSTSFHAVTTPEHRWLVNTKKGKVVERVSCLLSQNGDDRIHRTGEYNPDKESALSPDEAELLGWFLTDGSSRQLKSGRQKAYLYQSRRGNPEKCLRIEALLGRLDSEKEIRSGACRELTCWSLGRRLSLLLHSMCPDRTLTMETLLILDRPALERLKEAMLLGDGTKDQQVLSTGRMQQAEMFQILCTLTGTHAKVFTRDMSRYEPMSSKMRNVPKMGVIHLSQEKRRKTVQVVKGQFQTYIRRTRMWCPMVPNTFFVARRSGHVYITGNTPFQGLGARCAKSAIQEIAYAQYVDTGSPLYGCRTVAMVHDEVIAEAPEGRTHEAAHEMSRLMVVGANKYLPDCPIPLSKMQPTAMKYWSKNAFQVFDENKRLVAWNGEVAHGT